MESVLAIGLPGGPEWILIVLFIIIFFGAKKIPEIARGFGKGIREFKNAKFVSCISYRILRFSQGDMEKFPKKSQKAG